MEYDVYYSTGGLNMIGGGADVWVNKWLEMIPQHLKTESKLLIHRTRPPGHQPDCPMEVHWQGHDRKKFKELMDNATRRQNLRLFSVYTTEFRCRRYETIGAVGNFLTFPPEKIDRN